MQTFNGIGTTMYGKREVNPEDGSYIVTKWFVLIFFPIVPLGSYRVIKEKQSFFHGGFPKYQMTEVQLNRRQVVNTYLAWWGIPLAIIVYSLLYPPTL